MLNAPAPASHVTEATEASDASAIKSRPKPAGIEANAGNATEGRHSRVPPLTSRVRGGAVISGRTSAAAALRAGARGRPAASAPADVTRRPSTAGPAAACPKRRTSADPSECTTLATATRPAAEAPALGGEGSAARKGRRTRTADLVRPRGAAEGRRPPLRSRAAGAGPMGRRATPTTKFGEDPV